jgi:hypothetical protein
MSPSTRQSADAVPNMRQKMAVVTARRERTEAFVIMADD